MKRRSFLQFLSATLPGVWAGAAESAADPSQAAKPPSVAERGRYQPGRIPNEYSLFLPGEREALKNSPRLLAMGPNFVKARLDSEERVLEVGESVGGWQLLTILPELNGEATAVFEKRVTHQGAIVYLTERGEIASIPERIGELSNIRPRPTNTPHGIRFDRPSPYVPGPDVWGEYILNSAEDPCYENVAALGPEFTGWTVVGNEEAGPEKSLSLEADGKSRQLMPIPEAAWAPDVRGRAFDPRRFLPSLYGTYGRYPDLYEYVSGYSKRTLLGGYLPAAHIGVWNPKNKVGYEVMVILPRGAEVRPLARIRAVLPAKHSERLVPRARNAAAEPTGNFADQYWNGSARDFFTALAGIWGHWHHLFEDHMRVEIPDEWLLDAARASVALSRCAYHGLEPGEQIGEGEYTEFSVRGHALFPVAHYKFVWAHQLWDLAEEVEPYFQYYLDHCITPDGNFLYNTHDQVDAPLDAGVFLEVSARAYDYTHDVEALRKRLPVLRRMIAFVLARYRYTKANFPPDDPRHGLIWGSPEADNGDPKDDFPESHVYYYQNASWTWRGLKEHARCLERAGTEQGDSDLRREAANVARVAAEVRTDIERSLQRTLAARNPEMKRAEITPIFAFDTERKPAELGSYESHRYMMDWWTSDWGDRELDAGHFRHRLLAGLQMMGMNTNLDYPLTSNFMEHGTLAHLIRQDDYRPFLLTLYGNQCYAADSGNRYTPEDAMVPGSYAGEGNPGGWSAKVDSTVQPSIGLRWLLCYEEHDRNVVHLQKAAPQHWFKSGERIRVEMCPTRFGPISWTTDSLATATAAPRWRIQVQLAKFHDATLVVHIHSPERQPLKSASLGELHTDHVVLTPGVLAGQTVVTIEVA
ncbi:MAG: hypothetical protein LAO04_12595 [Acidobacteriia bacterium]|nr:hypothetical protein [Terriglobia bacterium]